jgi:chemotaxis protein methyltransferase CheR
VTPPSVPMRDSLGEMDAGTLTQVINLVREHTGITLSEGKRSMLQGRLRKRMRELGLHSYADYLQRLYADDAERQPFVDVVTTHQTSFFRTPRVWAHLRDVFLPQWRPDRAGAPLRIWSAAASTGEEACTAALCCEEWARQQPADAPFTYEILGTDISTEVLDHAREGLYAGASAAGLRALHPDLYTRYNGAKLGECFQLPERVRARISFAPHNLMLPPLWKHRFDVVLLRNVLIYFRDEDITGIVRRIAPAMRPQSLLIIGESESLSAHDVPFDFLQPQVYRLRAA